MRHVIVMKRGFPVRQSLAASGARRKFPLLAGAARTALAALWPGHEDSAGPLAYESKHPPQPLTEEEEAALVFAASGITGRALADCVTPRRWRRHHGGMVARTVASGDGLQTVALTVIDDRRLAGAPSPRIAGGRNFKSH